MFFAHGSLSVSEGHGGCVCALVAAHGFVASGSDDGSVRIWKGYGGVAVARLPAHSGPVLALTVSGML